MAKTLVQCEDDNKRQTVDIPIGQLIRVHYDIPEGAIATLVPSRGDRLPGDADNALAGMARSVTYGRRRVGKDQFDAIQEVFVEYIKPVAFA